MPSRRFSKLSKRLNELRQTALPAAGTTFPANQREVDQVISFYLLTHAEFEEFIEEWCRHILRKAEAKWQANQKLTCASVAAIGGLHWKPFKNQKEFDYFSKCFTTAVQSRHLSPRMGTLSKLVSTAFRELAKLIDKNNGIGPSNLRSILYRIGIKDEDLDPVWLGTLQTYSSIRGRGAHRSTMNSAKSCPDPTAAWTEVSNVLGGFRQIDSALQVLSSRN